MLVSLYRCPECGVTLKPATPTPEGKRIKCPKCGIPFAVKAEEEIQEAHSRGTLGGKRPAPADINDEDDLDSRPRRRRPPTSEDDDSFDPRPVRRPAKKKKGGNKGLVIGLVLGGVFLLLLVGAGAIGYFVILPLLSENKNLTNDNWDKLKVGMTRQQLEDLLGSGRRSSANDLTKELEVVIPGGQQAIGANPDMGAWNRGNEIIYRWKNKNVSMFSQFDGQDKTSKLVTSVFITHQADGGVVAKWKTPFFDFSLNSGNPVGTPQINFPQVQFNPPQAQNSAGNTNPFANPNMNQIKIGMPEAQVIALLGPPSATHPNFGGPNRKALHYPGGIIIINNGVVESK